MLRGGVGWRKIVVRRPGYKAAFNKSKAGGDFSYNWRNKNSKKGWIGLLFCDGSSDGLRGAD
jgi:hypothetical protein